MPMKYTYTAIPDSHIPEASLAIFQHLLDTYASETNKVISVWRCFSAKDMTFRPHVRSKTVLEIMKHQLLSERRFFGEFMSMPEPPASQLLPAHETPEDYVRKMRELAEPRLRVESRTGAVTVASRWICDWAFASSPQSGLTWSCFLFPLIEPGLAGFPHPALGKDSRMHPRKTRGTVW